MFALIFAVVVAALAVMALLLYRVLSKPMPQFIPKSMPRDLARVLAELAGKDDLVAYTCAGSRLMDGFVPVEPHNGGDPYEESLFSLCRHAHEELGTCVLLCRDGMHQHRGRGVVIGMTELGIRSFERATPFILLSYDSDINMPVVVAHCLGDGDDGIHWYSESSGGRLQLTVTSVKSMDRVYRAGALPKIVLGGVSVGNRRREGAK